MPPVPESPTPENTDILVREAMSEPVQVFDAHRFLADAARDIEGLTVRAVPVVAEDRTLTGVLIKHEALHALRKGDHDSRTIGDVCRGGVCVNVDDPVEAALRTIQEAGLGRVPVVDGGILVGEVNQRDIRYSIERQRAGARPGERAKIRWRERAPHKALTWGIELSGDAFIAKAEPHGVFGPDKAVLEIGPGYGRLLSACLDRGLAFRRYVAVDISASNVRHLSERFDRDDVDFVHADIETASLDERFDAVLSSLTLKHLYPSFEAALRNVERRLNPGAKLIFDLIEGEPRRTAPDVDYVRVYSRGEVEEILSAVRLESVEFDQVEHAPGWERLLVVARKPA